MIVAFTIGHTKSYNEALNNDPEHAYKLGATKDYEGGWIWKTAEEAQNFIQSDAFHKIDWGDGRSRNPVNFSVYKVLLVNGWKDVSSIPRENKIFNLLVDSRFIK